MKNCPNCDGSGEVPTVMSYPHRNGESELGALRKLAEWVQKNNDSRSKPSKECVRLLSNVLEAQKRGGKR